MHPGAARQYRWFGPGRVIGVELRNPRRLEDDDMPTQGGAPHSYWIRYMDVVLATGEVRMSCWLHTRCPTMQLQRIKQEEHGRLWKAS